MQSLDVLYEETLALLDLLLVRAIDQDSHRKRHEPIDELGDEVVALDGLPEPVLIRHALEIRVPDLDSGLVVVVDDETVRLVGDGVEVEAV